MNALDVMLKVLKCCVIGIAVGLLMVFFALTVHELGEINIKHPILILTLPFSALLISLIYRKFGEAYRAATSIAMDYIHTGEERDVRGEHVERHGVRISPWMGLVSYITASLSHLSGASVGKESVGVQIGLSASELLFRLDKKLFGAGKMRGDYYLMSGASAAFSSLFGSPVAGTIFGLTFSSPDTIRVQAMLPCLVSSYASFFISDRLGIHRVRIPHFSCLALNAENIAAALVFAAVIGLFTFLFVKGMEEFRKLMSGLFRGKFSAVLVPSVVLLLFLGGIYLATGKNEYSGLSLPLLYSSINGTGVPTYAFILKAVLLFLSLSAGFVGGEIIPLIVVGSTLGYTVSSLFGLNTASFAVLGALGMLSGGTNLPLMCFALGMELFGYTECVILFMVVCVSYLFSGEKSIYENQRLFIRKRILTPGH